MAGLPLVLCWAADEYGGRNLAVEADPWVAQTHLERKQVTDPAVVIHWS